MARLVRNIQAAIKDYSTGVRSVQGGAFSLRACVEAESTQGGATSVECASAGALAQAKACLTKAMVTAFLVSLCLLVVLGTSPSFAWADEPETSSDNTVNTNQLPDSSFLYDVPISELTTADSFHDQQTVQVKGEVVGDLIADESDASRCWVSLQELDTEVPAVVSLYMTREFAKQIDAFGHYGQQGTTLQVMGTFHLACSDHQGLSDIHVETVSVVASGKTINNEASSILFSLAWIFPLVGVLLVLYYRHRNEQER